MLRSERWMPDLQAPFLEPDYFSMHIAMRGKKKGIAENKKGGGCKERAMGGAAKKSS